MYLSLIQTVLTIIFGIVAVASIIVAMRLARRKKPAWAYVTKKVIGLGSDAPSELQLLFNGKSVPDVFRTILIFFNRGNQAIRRGDVSRIISVRLTGSKILREPTVRTSSEEIGFSTKQTTSDKDSVIDLDFSYLDHNDGAVLEILHTKYDKINCVGSVIEAGEPRYIGGFVSNRPKRLARRIAFATVFALFFPALFFAAILTSEPAVLLSDGLLPLLVMGFFSLLWIAQAFYSQRQLFRHMRFPKWSVLKE